MKDIQNYEGLYSVDIYGNVYNRHGLMLKNHLNKTTGYYQFNLTKNNKQKCFKVHRLVATHYIPNPDNLPQVNHKDGNKLNNNINNLEWCTNSYNQLHAYANDLKYGYEGVKHPMAKLTEAQVHEIRNLKNQLSQRAIAKQFNVSQLHVSRIHRNISWTHI